MSNCVKAAFLQEGDLLVVENPPEAWLVLRVRIVDGSERKIEIQFLPTHDDRPAPVKRILRIDLDFPLHFRLLRRDSNAKLNEVNDVASSE